MRTIPWIIALSLVVACGGGTDPAPPGPPPPPPPPPAGPTAMAIHAGDQQEAAPGAAVSVRPAVKVTDAAGHPYAGAAVTFAVDTGGGAIVGPTATTDADGIAAVGAWRVGPAEGLNRLRVTSGSLAPVLFRATARFLTGTKPSTPVAATVGLPAGHQLTVASLSAINSIGEVPVASDGHYTLPVYDGGGQLTMIRTAAGDPILLGWVDGQHPTIDARSTAAVLAFQDLGAATLIDARARAEAQVRMLALGAELDPLVAAIEAALKGAAPVTLGTGAVHQARAGLVTRYAAAARALRAATKPNPGASIDPLIPQSGIEVQESGYQQLSVTNWYRRRAVAFIDRLSYVLPGSQTEVPAATWGTGQTLGAVTGVRGVLGTTADIISGNMAYDPVILGPLAAPLYPTNAQSTKYRVTVVGMGHLQSKVNALTDEQLEAGVQAALETVVIDIVIPFVSNLLTTNSQVGAFASIAEQSQFLEAFLDLIPISSAEKAFQGDVAGAVYDVVGQILDSDDAREAFVNLMIDVMVKVGIPSPATLFDAAGKWLKVLTAIDLVLKWGDFVVTCIQTGLSEAAETWDIEMTGSKVALNPKLARIGLGEIQLYHAVVLDATGTGSNPMFEYKWTTTGQFGKIYAQGVSGGQTVITTSKDVISYASDGSTTGTDQIQLEVSAIVNGQKQLVGAEKATVEVFDGKVWLVPEVISVSGGESYTLTARVDPGRLDGGTLSYNWSTPGNFGSLPAGSNGLTTASAQVTYSARSGPEGTETLTVWAISTTNGVEKLLGKATATIKVEAKKTVYLGSYTTEVTSWPEQNHTRYCASFLIVVPLVPDAKEYSVRAYGFYDPLHWQHSVTFSMTPPFDPYLPCTERNTPIEGQSGNTYLEPITGGTSSQSPNLGAMTSRFTGMIVEVTVKY